MRMFQSVEHVFAVVVETALRFGQGPTNSQAEFDGGKDA
jgi:hypothetical protein